MRPSFVSPLALRRILSIAAGAFPLLLAARAWSAPATSPDHTSAPATHGCGAESRVEVNLTSWKAALKRATTSDRRDEVLKEMKLSLDLGDSETSDGPDGHDPSATRVTLLGIDEHLARLSATDLPDHIIQVRYRLDSSDDKTTAELIQVLRPFGGTSWCIIGADLSRQDDAAAKLETFELGFVPLLAAKTKAIEVRVVQTQLRHTETVRQYWVVEGFKLRKIFDEEIGSMDNIDNGRDTRVKTATLTLTGAFPKRIDVKQVVKHAVCDAQSGDAPCDDNEKSSTIAFVYNGKTYVRRK